MASSLGSAAAILARVTNHVLKHFPGKCFSAVSIFENVRTPVHKDSRNAHHDNLVLPLSGFTNGQIWLEDDKGAVPHDPEGQKLGRLLDVAAGPSLSRRGSAIMPHVLGLEACCLGGLHNIRT